MNLLAEPTLGQALADARNASLAAAHPMCQVQPQGVALSNIAALVYHLHTPSLYGRRPEVIQEPPVFFGAGLRRKSAHHGATVLFTLPEPNNLSCVVQSKQATQGQQKCPSKQSFSQASPAQVSSHAAIHSANRPLSAAPSVQVQQRSHRAASSRVQQSVSRATLPTARLTRTSVTDHPRRAGGLRTDVRAPLNHTRIRNNHATALLTQGGFLRSAPTNGTNQLKDPKCLKRS